MAVLQSEDSNFQELLNNNSKVIVKYYADWCGNCRLFKPKFRRLSEDERFSGIVFSEVNAETNPEARKMGDVNNLPTFAIFRDGKFVENVCASKEEIVVELINKL
ncbi:MAG: thioredoxin family protein [Cytophagaceae bacterium]